MKNSARPSETCITLSSHIGAGAGSKHETSKLVASAQSAVSSAPPQARKAALTLPQLLSAQLLKLRASSAKTLHADIDTATPIAAQSPPTTISTNTTTNSPSPTASSVAVLFAVSCSSRQCDSNASSAALHKPLVKQAQAAWQQIGPAIQARVPWRLDGQHIVSRHPLAVIDAQQALQMTIKSAADSWAQVAALADALRSMNVLAPARALQARTASHASSVAPGTGLQAAQPAATSDAAMQRMFARAWGVVHA